ncbi:MAG: hypothetical protein NTZ16_01390, partial [Verrucomicrobia bacterium]|nr:hypothetical protein [Verrucomicrobiota bacterium]
QFAKAKIPFYVCPGTSAWQTLVGKHDNAFANLRAAAKAGRKHGALGYLITDWGDGGHPQPLAVSWPLFAAGAALAWNAKGFDESKLGDVLSRDIFGDTSGKVAGAALRLGVAHRKLGIIAPNETPLGTVIAAYPPELRELFCRNGAKWFAKIPAANIRAALREIEKQIVVLSRLADRQVGPTGNRKILVRELELAARMAAESCHIMLWQQAVAAGKLSVACRMAAAGIGRLEKIEREFKACWPLRNKGATRMCTPFLRWRIADYRRGRLVAN